MRPHPSGPFEKLPTHWAWRVGTQGRVENVWLAHTGNKKHVMHKSLRFQIVFERCGWWRVFGRWSACFRSVRVLGGPFQEKSDSIRV
jgi:hypothetical protein